MCYLTYSDEALSLVNLYRGLVTDKKINEIAFDMDLNAHNISRNCSNNAWDKRLKSLDRQIDLINFAGTPPTIVFDGTFCVTTAPAATIEFSPTVKPGRIIAPAPIHAFLPM